MQQQVVDSGSEQVISDRVNPSEEDTYWRNNYRSRPYSDENVGYDQYRPAFRYGWESRVKLAGQRWTAVEKELERGWRENRGASHLCWNDARDAVKDAWHRVDHQIADARVSAT